MLQNICEVKLKYIDVLEQFDNFTAKALDKLVIQYKVYNTVLISHSCRDLVTFFVYTDSMRKLKSLLKAISLEIIASSSLVYTAYPSTLIPTQELAW